MKNITEYNEFVKLNKSSKLNELNETPIGDTGGYGKGAGGGGDDLYFANVKGNLAGAENTLVGAAVLKLFGFIKRKGIQMYMKRVLKPRLGRIYMNGILRYANKEHIGNFARMEWFSIQKMEGEETSKFESKVGFELSGFRGLDSFQQGATVLKQNIETREAGDPLEDGKYILNYNAAEFTVVGGLITEIEAGGASEVSGDKPPVAQVQISGVTTSDEPAVEKTDSDFDEYIKKYKEELEKAEKEGVRPEKWVVEECEAIKAKLDTNVDTIDELDIDNIKREKLNLKSGIQIFEKTIEEINSIIEKGGDGIKNLGEIRWQRLVYIANLNELVKLSNFLNSLINQYNEKKSKSLKRKPVARRSKTEASTETAPEKNESFVFEAEQPVVVKDQELNKQNIAPTKKKGLDVKTDRLGDDLQEIAKRGETIDLNDEEFYKQFESEDRRKGVTQEILQDKSAIAKIELDAERLIGGNAKQQNAWDRMVENVKAMYSKYMITDLVDPKSIVKGLPEGDVKKIQGELNKSKDGQNSKGITDALTLEKVSLWASNTVSQNNLGKSFEENQYLIVNVEVKGEYGYYVIQRVKSVNGLFFYRVLGIFDMNKVIANKEKYDNGSIKDFTDEIVKMREYASLDPTEKNRDGAQLVTLYFVSETVMTYGSNGQVALVYLYSETLKDIRFNKDTTFYTLRNADPATKAMRLPKSGDLIKKSDNTYAVHLQQINARKITHLNLFGIDANEIIDITNEMSVKKLGGLDTMYKK